jgi:ABC-2 type transport system permease protein
MKKIFLIGWKDIVLAFRDQAALIMMLAAPFALTLGLGFVTGAFSGSGGGGLNDIPIVLVNQDGGQLGNELVNTFQSADLQSLVAPSSMDDTQEARRQVDENKAAAAVIIPPGFTASIIPAQGSASAGPLVQIELYTNPSSPTSVGIIQTIVEEFVSRVEIGRVSAKVAVSQLISHGLIQTQDAAQVGGQIGANQANAAGVSSAITLKGVATGGEAVKFNALAYMAPGMALMFLMFTVGNGGRTLLAERAQGTLTRMLVAPTTTAQVLAGKVFGIILTGAVQMLILILASTLFFGLRWGDPLAVLVLVLAAVFGATGWGMIITSLVKTPGQVSAFSSAVMLIFGILGGSFLNISSLPAWFQVVSKITPNAWGLDGFTTLALGGGMMDILQPLAGLFVMGVVLFVAASFMFNRRGIVER